MIDNLFLKLHNKVYNILLNSNGSLNLSPFFGYELRIFIDEKMDEKEFLVDTEAFFLHFQEENEDYFLINLRDKNESTFIHELQHAYFCGLNGDKYKDLVKFYYYLLNKTNDINLNKIGYFLYFFNNDEFNSFIYQNYIYRDNKDIINHIKLLSEVNIQIVNYFVTSSDFDDVLKENYFSNLNLDKNLMKNQINEIIKSSLDKRKYIYTL